MSESTMTVYEDGVKEWHDEDGLLHREGGLPAVIYPNGATAYYEHGIMQTPPVTSEKGATVRRLIKEGSRRVQQEILRLEPGKD